MRTEEEQLSRRVRLAVVGVAAVLVVIVTVALAGRGSHERPRTKPSPSQRNENPPTLTVAQECQLTAVEWVSYLDDGTATPNDVLFQFGRQDPIAALILDAWNMEHALAYQIGIARATQRMMGLVRYRCEDIDLAHHDA